MLNMPIMLAYPVSKTYDSFCDDHVPEYFHKTFKAWYKTKKGNFIVLNIIPNFLFYYHFIYNSSYLSEQEPASVADVTYFSTTIKILVLF